MNGCTFCYHTCTEYITLYRGEEKWHDHKQDIVGNYEQRLALSVCQGQTGDYIYGIDIFDNHLCLCHSDKMSEHCCTLDI